MASPTPFEQTSDELQRIPTSSSIYSDQSRGRRGQPRRSASSEALGVTCKLTIPPGDTAQPVKLFGRAQSPDIDMRSPQKTAVSGVNSALTGDDGSSVNRQSEIFGLKSALSGLKEDQDPAVSEPASGGAAGNRSTQDINRAFSILNDGTVLGGPEDDEGFGVYTAASQISQTQPENALSGKDPKRSAESPSIEVVSGFFTTHGPGPYEPRNFCSYPDQTDPYAPYYPPSGAPEYP